MAESVIADYVVSGLNPVWVRPRVCPGTENIFSGKTGNKLSIPGNSQEFPGTILLYKSKRIKKYKKV
jgi:hypothetical protein